MNSGLYSELKAYVRNTSLQDVAVLLFITSYPFSVKVALIFLVLHFILTFRLNFTGIHLSYRSIGWIAPACIVFYFLHILSLSYSDNLQHGLKDVETKFGFLIFPFLTLFIPRSERQTNLFIRYFVFSFTLVSLICIIRALFFYVASFDTSFLFYDQFSFLMHPTYFTMHLAIALIFHLYLYHSNKNETEYCKSLWLFNAVTAILLIAVFLTSSRAGILIAIGSSVIYLTGYFIPLIKGARSSIITLATVSLLMIVVMMAGSSRFSILINELSGKQNSSLHADPAQVDESPVAHRLTLMKVAYDLFLKHPLGVGVGDVQDLLVEEYKLIGYEKAALVRYNPHNQYLQTAASLGIPGLLLLIIILAALILAVKRHDHGKLLFFAGIILALNGLFESVFEVQRGVLLLTLILVFLLKNEKATKIS